MTRLGLAGKLVVGLVSYTFTLTTSESCWAQGTNGGVTKLGLAASTAGGLFVGLCFYCAALVSPTLRAMPGQAAAAARQWQLVPLGALCRDAQHRCPREMGHGLACSALKCAHCRCMLLLRDPEPCSSGADGMPRPTKAPFLDGAPLPTCCAPAYCTIALLRPC